MTAAFRFHSTIKPLIVLIDCRGTTLFRSQLKHKIKIVTTCYLTARHVVTWPRVPAGFVSVTSVGAGPSVIEEGGSEGREFGRKIAWLAVDCVKKNRVLTLQPGPEVTVADIMMFTRIARGHLGAARPNSHTLAFRLPLCDSSVAFSPRSCDGILSLWNRLPPERFLIEGRDFEWLLFIVSVTSLLAHL